MTSWVTYIKLECERHCLTVLASFGKVMVEGKVIEQLNQLLIFERVPCEDEMSRFPYKGTDRDISTKDRDQQ